MSWDPCLSQSRLSLTHAKVHNPPPHKGLQLAHLILWDVSSRCLFTSWKLFYWMHNKTRFGSNRDMTQLILQHLVSDYYASRCQRLPFDLLYKCWVFHLEYLSFSIWIYSQKLHNNHLFGDTSIRQRGTLIRFKKILKWCIKDPLRYFFLGNNYWLSNGIVGYNLK